MVRLDRLVNVLGGYGVRLTGGRVPRSTELRHVVLPETLGGRPVAGDVLLAIGATSVAEAVRWAEAARAVVVMVKVDEAAGPGDEAADATAPLTGDIAVMTVDPAVSWSELAGVVFGLVLEGRETESGRGPTDLFSLADSVAEAIGGAVTIEDPQSRVLAYSGLQQHADPARVETILGRQAPERLRRRFQESGVFAHLAASDEPLFIPPDPEHGLTGRMVAAVRAGRELLGSVWVTAAAPLDQPGRQALLDAARTVALHLLRSRVSADLERQIESDLVTRLLAGTADAATIMSRLGLPPGPIRVIAVRPRGERQAALLLTFERATTGFGWSRPGRSALDGTTVYTLLPGEAAAAARRWTEALAAALPPSMALAAGISAAASMTELPAARQEADECLALHERRPADAPPPVYDESWHDILLQRLRTAARTGRAPARGPIAELRRHDLEHGTQYVTTLRAWLEAQGDPAVAAAQLGVHENTVRNRLRRMATMTSLDLQDPRRRLAMMIELAADDPSPGDRQSQ